MSDVEPSRAQPWRFGLALVATAVVFVIDLQTPWGVASWILYAFPLFLLCRHSGDRHLVPFAALVSALIVLDHFLSEPAAPLAFSIFNRSAALVTLWITVWLLLRRERAHRALEQLRERLETTVADRTANLEAANAALRQVEAALTEGNRRLQIVVGNSIDIATLLDADLRIRYISAPVRRILGHEPDALLGTSVLDLAHPDDIPAIVAALEGERTNPGSTRRVEHRARHRDGAYLWFESTGWFPPGEPYAGSMVVNSREIGERKRAEAERRRSEEEVRLLFEHSPVGIARASAEGRYTLVNPAMCRLLGYPPEELLRLTIADVTHPEDAESNEELRQRLYRGEINNFTMEKRYLRKGGESFWARVTVAAVRDEHGAVLYTFGSTEDITGQKEGERTRIEALERQRDALVREVHHRIKNNLQGVVGLLDRHAREHPEIDAPMHAAMARVNAIAALHGLYAGSATPRVDLCGVIAAIGQYLGTLFPEIALQVGTPADWRMVQLEEREAVSVALIVNELLLNAVKSGVRERSTDPVRTNISGDGDEVCVSIVNAAGRLPEGFDLASARGLGTGLTLARSLLPPQGARLSIRQLAPQGVEAKLCLSAPVIVGSCGETG